MPDGTRVQGLESSVNFTLQDHQRLLRQSDVAGICPTPHLCFDCSDRVRCGPCAIKQAEFLGVATDYSLPFAPEQYRLQRRVKAMQEEAEQLSVALEKAIEEYAHKPMAAELQTALKLAVARLRTIAKEG